MCCNSNSTGQKLMKYKVNTNLMFSLPSKLLILIINAESCFFLPLLNPFFHRDNLPCFSFKIKDQMILSELVYMLKNNLSLIELDSKATPTLILLVAMSTSEPIFSTNSLPAMAARHAEEFQVCVLERP